jgi:hypothetical protein
MLANVAGQRILDGLVTVTNFAGPPLIGCCDDYFDVDPAQDIDNPVATMLLFAFANSLGAPAIVTDTVHDGFTINATLRNGLIANARFCVPGHSGNFLFSFGAPPVDTPLCGPIITMDGVTFGTAKAQEIAGTTLNYRRSHYFRKGCDAVYPSNSPSLDFLQAPPVYKPSILTYNLDSNGMLIATNHYIFLSTGPNSGYFDILLACWTAPTASIFSTFAGQIVSPQVVFTEGLMQLATLEGTYPGVSRHITPWLTPLLLLP